MAVAADQLITMRLPGTGRLTEGLAAAEALYKGTLAFINSSGYLTATAGGNEFAGMVRKAVDNSGGAAGDKKVELFTDADVVLPGTSFTQATVGQPIYAVDNYATSGTSTSNSYIGTCTRYISATSIEVRLEIGRRATGGG